ncbi:MAG TPA: VIT domain-containing protein [Allosphingosinicella sp.]|jgi:tetratricopeptide (TPR) repeat protein
MNRLSLALRTGALLLSAVSSAALAAANPELTALIRGVDDDEARSTSLRIESMDVAVRLHGGIAETLVTARFHNAGTEELEGRFRLQMPDGSVVTGYALDIGGEMIEGVLLDQLQARRAYESQVRKRIDPGLGEVSRGFQFTTRVYPIDPGKSRTVRVRFVTPLEPGRGYAMPLDNDAEVGRFSLTVEADGESAPQVELPGGAAARWSGDGAGRRLAFGTKGKALRGELAIRPAAVRSAIAVGAGPGGERFFEIADSAPAAPREASRPRSVAILWDRSLSRADDRVTGEIALLRAWLEAVRPAAIDLILFDSSGAERVRLADRAAVEEWLRSVRYGGASSYAPLAVLDIQADQCLLFTDGLVTIDRGTVLAPACPLTAISSAADADRAALGALAQGMGGEALRLGADNQAELLRRLGGGGARVVRVRSAAGAPIDAVRLDSPEGGWRLVGPMPQAGGVVVTLSGVGAALEDRLYAPPGRDAAWSGAANLWAADRLAVRGSAGDESREALVAFARRYSVAGPDISFLVLETAEDYARSKIEPPANFPADQVARYRELAAEAAEEEGEEKADRLGEVVKAWEGQKAWWDTRFDPKAKADPRKRGDNAAAAELPPAVVAPAPPAPPGEREEPAMLQGMISSADAADSGEGDIIVTSSRIEQSELQMSAPFQGEPAATSEWASTRPYMALLRAVPAARRDSVFAEQQALHGALPAFWFDVAELAWREGRPEEARRLLLSALDLPTRNNETLAIVAERLFRYGEEERAIEMFEAAAAAEPERPQPLRSLALALGKRSEKQPPDAARADLGRAIDLLSQVITKPWEGRYDGIELIALMEVNRLIVRYRALGGGAVPLDPRLIALLEVDVRVVIEWDTEATDLDLWVDEPNGERAMYSNAKTLIGGRMSEDMTRGYGPEEYLLRRAPAGTFTIRADVYAADAINPNGASRITARLIRNFGRPNEKEELVEIELLPDRDGDRDADTESIRLIGKLRVR